MTTYTYTIAIQTGISEWSVFVRKLDANHNVVGVIQHKFDTQSGAEIFAKNNWNLGEYF